MSKNKRFSRGNLIFLFVAAFLAGAIAKKAIGNNIRIGFDDPNTIIMQGELYDIDELEQKLLKNGIPKEMPIEEVIEIDIK
ncbi:MAG: hypothetical protein ACKUBY_03290 [Candidatus Moraniibacteriota bacterium]|jgi:hypothetical protein